jgi:hypothetical protein
MMSTLGKSTGIDAASAGYFLPRVPSTRTMQRRSRQVLSRPGSCAGAADVMTCISESPRSPASKARLT